MHAKRLLPIFTISFLVLVAVMTVVPLTPQVHASGGIIRVQGNSRGTSTTSSISVTMASTPTSGNLLIACIGSLDSNPSYDSVSSISEGGVTWTKQIQEQAESYIDSEIWVGVVGSGASVSITINLASTPNYGAVADVCEYSGLATSGFLDKTATNGGSSTSPSTGTTAATSQANELWIGCTTLNYYGQSTPTNGFTLLDGAAFGTDMSLAYLENIVTSTGTASSGTAGGGSNWWAGCIATFSARAASNPPTSVPSGVLSYVPVTLANSQTSAVSGGSQVSITINWNTYSSYLDNPVNNYVFFNNAGNTLYSWLESGTSSSTTNALVWLKLDSNGIPASSSITVYLGFTVKGTSVLSSTGATGVAPTLCTSYTGGTYGSLDNGAYVFAFYDNFAGTSLNARWTKFGTGTESVNNGVSLTATGSTLVGIFASYTPPTTGIYTETYMTDVSAGAGYRVFDGNGITSSSTSEYNGYVGILHVASGNNLAISKMVTGTKTDLATTAETLSAGSFYKTSLEWQDSPNTKTMADLTQSISATSTTDTTYTLSSVNQVSLALGGSTGNEYTTYWFRVRQAPPSGVMPAASFGSNVEVSVTINLVASSGSTAISASNYFTVIYTQGGVSGQTASETGTALTLMVDPNTVVSLSGTSSASTSSEEWVFNNGATSATFTPTSTVTQTFYYYDLLSQAASYSVTGGGSLSAPSLLYSTAPASAGSTNNPLAASLTLTTSSLNAWALRGSAVSIPQTIVGTTGVQGVVTTYSWTISAANQVSNPATYQTQYYLTVTGGSSPTGQGWVNSGSTTTASNAWVWGTSGSTRTALTNWQLDGTNENPSRADSGTFTTSSITMNTYHTVNFVSTTQYYLTVTGGNSITYGTASPTSDNWYDSGTSTTVSSNGVYSRSGGTGTRMSSWNVDGGSNTNVATTGTVTTSSVTMSTSHTVNFNSVTQYQVTLDAGATSALSSITNPTISNDNYWYDSGTSVTLVLNGVYGRSSGTGTRVSGYKINGGSNNAESTTGTFDPLSSVSISGVEAITTTTVTQYFLTVTGGNGVAYGTASTILGDTGWYDSGSSTTVSSNWVWNTETGQSQTGITNYVIDGVNQNPTQQYSGTLTTSSITMSTYHTVAFASNTEYYLTVSSAYSTTSGSGWYNSGATAYAGLTSGTVSGGTGVQYVFASWSLGGTTYSASNAITMSTYYTDTASWTTQYYLTVTSSYGSPSGAGWYNAGDSATFGVTTPVSIVSGQSQYAFSSWTGSGTGEYSGTTASTSVTMNNPITEIASWNTQYYITVVSAYGTPTEGSQYVNASLPFTTSVTSPADVTPDVSQFVANEGTLSITSVTAPQTLTFTWTEQFYITVDNGGHGSPSEGSQFVNESLPFSTSVVSPADTDSVAGTQYVANVGTLSIASVSGPQTLTFTWTEQFYITVVSPYGSPTEGSQWVNATLPFTTSVTSSPVDTISGSQWLVDEDTLSIASVSGPQTLTFTWTEQFYITVVSPYGSPTEGSQWVNATLPFTTSVTSSPVDTISGSQWLVDEDTLSIASVSGPQTLTFTWTEQFYITVVSPYGSPTEGSQWVNATLPFTTSVTSSPVDTISGSQWLVDEDTLSIASVSGPQTLTFTWTEQFYITVVSPYGSPTEGSQWVNATLPFTTSVTSSPVDTISGSQWLVDEDTLSIASVSGPQTLTFTWTEQFYITVVSPYGSPTEGSQWVNATLPFTTSVTSSPVDTISGSQWLVDEDTLSIASVSGPQTLTFTWTEQFYITVVSPYGSPTEGSQWVNATLPFTTSVTSSPVDTISGSQWLVDEDTLSIASVSGPQTLTFTWTEQFYITVVSPYGSPTEGSQWVNATLPFTTSVTSSPVDTISGSQWLVDEDTLSIASVSGPQTLTFTWTEQFYITVVSPYGSPTEGSQWVNATLPFTTSVTSSPVDTISGSQWLVDEDTLSIASVSGPQTLTFTWTEQFYITVVSPYGSPTEGSQWVNATLPFTTSVTSSPVDTISGSQWLVDEDTLSIASVSGPQTLTFTWTEQFYITVVSPYGSPTEGSQWVNATLPFTTSVTSSPVDTISGSQWLVDEDTLSIASVSGPQTLTFTWTEQFYITVVSPYGSPTEGSQWVNATLPFTTSVTSSPVDTISGSQWLVDEDTLSIASVSGPQTLTFTWTEQFYITVVSPYGSPTEGSQWVNATLPFTTSVTSSPVDTISGSQWLVDEDTLSIASVSGPQTLTFTWTEQFYITVVSPYGSPTEGSQWVNATLPFTTSVTSSPVDTISGSQWLVDEDTLSIASVSGPQTLTFTWTEQFYITVVSPYGSPTEGSQWVNATLPFTTSVTSSPVDTISGSQWLVDEDTLSIASVSGPQTLTFTWTEQFYITVVSPYGSPTEGSQWVNATLPFTTSVTSSPVDTISGSQWLVDEDTLSIASVSGPQTLTFTWTEQFYITVVSPYGSPTEGSQWVNATLPFTTSVTSSPVDTISGSQWLVDEDTLSIASVSGPQTLTFTWTEQFYITVVSPYGSPTEGSQWVNATLPFTTSVTSSPVDTISGSQWLVDEDTLSIASVSGPQTLTFTWTEQFYITVVSPYGSPTEGSQWVNATLPFTTSVTSSPVDTISGSQWLVDEDTLSIASVSGPQTLTFTWTEQFYITVVSPYGSPTEGSQWVNATLPFTTSVTSSPVDTISGSQWLVDEDTLSIASVSGPQTLTFTWTEQFYITVVSPYGSPTEGSQWVNATLPFTTSVTSSPVDTISGSQWLVDEDTLSIASVSGPQTLTFTWTEQFYITVVSAYGTPTEASQYVNASLPFTTSVTSPADVTPDVSQFVANEGTLSITSVTAPQTLTFTWTEQYMVTFAVSPSGSGSASPSGSNVWENAGSLSITATPNAGYTFSNWSSDTGSITFSDANSASTTATINGPGTITSNFFLSELDHFVFNTVGAQTAGTSFTITITAVDSSGNTVTSYSGTPILTVSAGSISPSFATGGFSNGVWTGSVTVTAAGSDVTLGVNDGMGHTGTSNPFTVSGGPLASITISPVTQTLTAGNSQVYSAEGYDQYGNDLGPIAASYSVNGVGISGNTITETQAGTYTLEASYGGFTADASLTVSGGPLASITISPVTQTLTAGNSQVYSAEGYDQYGNDLGPIAASYSVNGVGISGNTITETQAGTYTITASYDGRSDSTTLTVTVAGLDHIVISPGVRSIIAGGSQVYSATAFDAFGNSWSVTATYSIQSGAVGSVIGNSVSATVAGSWTVTGSFGGKIATATLTVTAAGLNHFVFSSVSTQTAGTSFTITVTAVDAYENTITGYSGAPSLTVSSGTISPDVMNAFVGGVGSTSVTVTAAASGVTITASDGSHSGTSNSFTVESAATPTPTPTPTPAPTPTPTPSPSSTSSTTTFTISVCAGDNGAISPAGSVSVNSGGSQCFTITPDTGYHVADVIVDGVSQGSVSSYAFTDVLANHTITASFGIDTNATSTLIGIITNTNTIIPITQEGNISLQQFLTNVTFVPYPHTASTSVSFTITGPSGTVGFSNMTFPKIDIPYGTIPRVYINGTLAANQGYTQDANNFYVWFTTHFSTHQVTIQFTTQKSSASPLGLALGALIGVGATISIFTVIVTKRRRKPALEEEKYNSIAIPNQCRTEENWNSTMILTEKGFNQLLLESINEALSTLGGVSKAALYLHLEREFTIKEKEIPQRLDDFSFALERILGKGAAPLDSLMIKTFMKKLPEACHVDQKGLTFQEYVTQVKEYTKNMEKEKARDLIGVYEEATVRQSHNSR